MTALARHLDHFFSGTAPLGPEDSLIVAFSGGPDSSALLAGLETLSRRRPLRLVAAHLDHAMDGGSSARARRAAEIASSLNVTFVGDRRCVPRLRRRGESLEEAARRVRYQFLEEVRCAHDAAFIATGHQADDQLETLIVRLSQGSGARGLSGVRVRHDRLVRPLLGLSRRSLRHYAETAGLPFVEDPGNLDARSRRSSTRNFLLPALGAVGALGEDPACLARRSVGLAAAAQKAREAIDRRLERHLDLRRDPSPSVDRSRFEALPSSLVPWALALLHERAGLSYPPSAGARRELLRQLGSGCEIGCDCARQWRWEATGKRLRIVPMGTPRPVFSYTFVIPGELWIPELSVWVRLVRGRVQPWMFEAQPRRAGMDLDLEPGSTVTVRNRRRGDRVLAFGSSGERRLQDLLSARRIPRRDRWRLPLLCTEDRILWVPGVTQDARTRVPGERDPRPQSRRADQQRVWSVEIESVEPPGSLAGNSLGITEDARPLSSPGSATAR